MSVLFIIIVIIISVAAAGAAVFVRMHPHPSLPDRKPPDAVPEENYIPLETYGLYCCIKEKEDGILVNDVFRFYDNAGKNDNGAVLSAVISQRKPEDGYFPKEKWFNLKKYEYQRRPLEAKRKPYPICYRITPREYHLQRCNSERLFDSEYVL